MIALLVVVAVAAAVRGTWSPCGLSMLTSMSPLSERARGTRWGWTASWYIAGATVGGLTLGAGLALVARAGQGVDVPAWFVAVAALVTAAADTGMVPLPAHHRQVNERWLDQYRPWVYGAGFGWQIGAGYATYLMTAANHLLVALAFASGSPAAALAAGALFGVVRGSAVLLARRVRTPEDLRHQQARLHATGPASRTALVVIQLAVAAVAAPLAAVPAVAVLLRRRRAVVASVLVAAVLAPATAAWAEPAPTPLPGAENGRVPDNRLIFAGPGCRVAREAGSSLALLFRTARMNGINLTGRDCYRPLDDQVAVGAQATAAGNSACAAQPTRGRNGQVQGTSNHGWGKAVDFGDPSPMGFGSVGYRFLKGAAEGVGWYHPAWAEPGGSACPEAWHWEWVGDASPDDTVAVLPTGALVTGLGAVRGDATFGGAESIPLQWVIVSAAATPDRGGYWLVAGDGGIFSFGNAAFYGSTGSMRLNQPIIGMAPTPSGRGYWLVAADGGIFSFGDAVFHGSTGSMRLNKPIVGMAATPSGGGYWLVASDGGIFSFGDAVFRGSTGAVRLDSPITAMAATPSGSGYWLVGADGGVFTFGDAGFRGSAAKRFATPVVGMASSGDGGYLVVAADGGVVRL